MTKAKHTPGPWVARRVSGVGLPNQIGYAIDFNEDQEQVVDYVYEEADARLIAAAPELLEALESLIECMRIAGCQDVVMAIRARSIVNKAKGLNPDQG